MNGLYGAIAAQKARFIEGGIHRSLYRSRLSSLDRLESCENFVDQVSLSDFVCDFHSD